MEKKASQQCEVKPDFRQQVRARVRRTGKGTAHGGTGRVRRKNGTSYMWRQKIIKQVSNFREQ